MPVPSGSRFPGAPGKKQDLISQMIIKVPAMVPMTMPAIAPPERVLGQVSEEEEEVDCLANKVGALIVSVSIVWFWYR